MSNPYGNNPQRPGQQPQRGQQPPQWGNQRPPQRGPQQPTVGQQPRYGVPQPGFAQQQAPYRGPQQPAYAGQYYSPGGAGMPPHKPQGKVNTFLIVAIAGALLIGVVAWALFGRGGSQPVPTPNPTTGPTTSQPAPTTTEPEPPTTEPPTNTEPPTTSGTAVDLGRGVSVVLPSGWTVHEEVEPGLVVVTDGLGYVTLQTIQLDSGVDASQIMTMYLDQQTQNYQNAQVQGPEGLDVGTDGTASKAVITGTQVTSSGSNEVVLGAIIGVRSADGVGILTALLGVPDLWDLSIDGYNDMTSQMLTGLLG